MKSSNVDHTSISQTSEAMTTANEDVEVEEMEEKDASRVASTSELDLTKSSESEPEEQDESGNVSSLGNKSVLSNSSGSLLSECSPEKSECPTTTTANTVRLAL